MESYRADEVRGCNKYSRRYEESSPPHHQVENVMIERLL